MARRRPTRSAKAGTRPSVTGGAQRAARTLLQAGVITAIAAVPLAFNPLGYNWFGPAKAAVLTMAVFLVVLGLSIDSTAVASAGGILRRSRVVYPLVVIAVLACASIAVNQAKVQSLLGMHPEYQGALLWLGAVIIGFGALAAGRPGTRVFSRAVTVAALVSGSAALGQMVGIGPLSRLTAAAEDRIGSTLGNASNLGVYLVLAVPIAVWVARRDQSRSWRWTGWLAIAVGTAAIAMSMSRGAWLGAIAGAAVWIAAELWSPDRRHRARLLWVAVGLVVALCVAALVVPGVPARVSSAFDVKHGSVKWRVAVWGAALKMVADRPVLGWGPNGFHTAYPAYRPIGLRRGKELSRFVGDPHNIFVSAAASLGVGGALALLALVGIVGWDAIAGVRKRDPRQLFLVARASSLSAGLVALQFHFVTLDTLPLLAVLVALALPRREDASVAASAPANAPKRGLVAAGWVLAGLSAAAAGLGVALVFADASAGRGVAIAMAKGPWEQASANIERAQRLAPWETAYVWAEARAAGSTLSGGFDDQVFEDGIAAISVVRRRLPLESSAALDQGRLLLMAGSATGNRRDFSAARDAFSAGVEADPYNARQWEGMGLSYGGLGAWESAKDSYQRALRLDPRSAAALSGMAMTYDGLGEFAKAAEYKRRAAALK